MDNALKELITISRTVGRDPELVQGGGGNTSVKAADGKHMYIKASGTALACMDSAAGWRRLCLEPVLSMLHDKRLLAMSPARQEAEVVSRLLLACDDSVRAEARPSVEAHIHAFLDRVVVHLHPIAIGAFVNAREGKGKLLSLFAQDRLPPLWIPYVDPGLALARRVSAETDKYVKRFGRKPEVVFLEKHGLLVSAESSAVAMRLVKSVTGRCRSALKKTSRRKTSRLNVTADRVRDAGLAIRRAVFEATGRYTKISFFNGGVIDDLCRRDDAGRLLSAAALTPDELVYANGGAVWLEDCDRKRLADKIAKRFARCGRYPSAFAVRGLGVFAAANGRMGPVIGDVIRGSLFVRLHAAGLGGIAGLNNRQMDVINKWESEAFRMKVASGTSDKVLCDRIAVVTGAGSGLGRSIALGLAGAGAVVGLADNDAEAAGETAELIGRECPNAETVVLICDVTNQAAVEKAFATVLDRWGGLDILVNAAGIAPAYRLVDFDAGKWRRALEVNLTGYFLTGRQAARVMIRQAMGGSIINISSKSGLEASRDNTAYNATKAGQIHMARGWALELGDKGIRVNSIAPGNVFEGSKIWNPAYIRACAKKYGIEPHQVIPYYVDKTALKRQITGADIASCAVFLCSDAARTITGQTLVADAGQVMVR